MRPENTVAELAGVPVHYDRYRSDAHGYGTRGRPVTLHCTAAFEEKLQACFEELWDVCPLGRAEVVTTAGAYVDKPGAHSKGRAFDLDGLFWSERAFVARNYPREREFYLAVEAVLRKHFGTVLNYRYNAAHRDHFHIDDLAQRGFYKSHRSRVLFLQMILTHLFETPVAVDGIFGPETSEAAREMLVRRELASPGALAGGEALDRTLGEVWFDLLGEVARAGFADATAASPPASGPDETPLALLNQVYAAIDEELGDTALRKPVETALTAFARHEDTDAWLDQFRDA
jgi:hypothetical protein